MTLLSRLKNFGVTPAAKTTELVTPAMIAVWMRSVAEQAARLQRPGRPEKLEAAKARLERDVTLLRAEQKNIAREPALPDAYRMMRSAAANLRSAGVGGATTQRLIDCCNKIDASRTLFLREEVTLDSSIVSLDDAHRELLTLSIVALSPPVAAAARDALTAVKMLQDKVGYIEDLRACEVKLRDSSLAPSVAAPLHLPSPAEKKKYAVASHIVLHEEPAKNYLRVLTSKETGNNYYATATKMRGTSKKISWAIDDAGNERALYTVRLREKKASRKVPPKEHKTIIVKGDEWRQELVDIETLIPSQDIFEVLDFGHKQVMVTNLFRGDAFDFLEDAINVGGDAADPYFIPLTLRLVQQMLHGLGEFHAMGLVHNDVKLENAFMDDTGFARLADLGYKRWLTDSIELRRLPAGTFQAPEVFVYHEPVTPASDIFAVGVVLATVLSPTLNTLFSASRFPAQGEIGYRAQLIDQEDWFHSTYLTQRADVESGLQRDNWSRGFREVRDNSSLTFASYLFDRLLHPQPEKRPPAFEIETFVDAEIARTSDVVELKAIMDAGIQAHATYAVTAALRLAQGEVAKQKTAA